MKDTLIRKPGNDPVPIAGAGIAGLSAAITLARAGRQVVVHEQHPEVGHRFEGDFQGLENWTTKEDILSVLEAHGLTTEFARWPGMTGTFYDSERAAYPIRSDDPIFYLVERGPGPDTIDSALLRQAIELGVEVRFQSRLSSLVGPGILASGPKAADAIAVGYHFTTTMEDGYWAILDDDLAPQGYAYLLIWNGRGTVKTCMFRGFKEEKKYVARTVQAFQELTGLEMIDPVEHGGFGNFRIPHSAMSGPHLMVGENAGFQDTLWGFGMRFAISSGILAARSLLDGSDYDHAWQRQLEPAMQTSVVNRWLFSRLGNKRYSRFLAHALRRNPRSFLHRHYAPSLAKRLLGPLARRSYRSRRHDESCNHLDCECIWCRHGQAPHHAEPSTPSENATSPNRT